MPAPARFWLLPRWGPVLGLALSLLQPAVALAAPTHFQGLSLAEALRRLETQGLTLVFTAELVRPEMTVGSEPAAREPRRVLAEILAPHGLAAEEAVPEVWVVVAARQPQASATLEGFVLGPTGSVGLGGVRLYLAEAAAETESGADGSFRLPASSPGTYTLLATAQGYLEQRIESLRVEAGRARRVVLRLQPQPYLEDEIVVRPSQLSMLGETSSSFALGREEIDSLPHLGGDVFRAAGLLPGVATNDISAELSIRGGRRDEVKILLDGQELYGPFHLKDYDSALSVVPARLLAKADLATGALPADEGDRMGGVLDLTTLEPEPGRQLTLALSVFDLLGSAGGTFAGERGRWLLAGRRGSLALAGDAIGARGPRFWDALGKVELGSRLGRFSAHFLAAGDALEVQQEEEDGFERLDNRYENGYGWLRHQWVGRRLLVESHASYARLDTERVGSGIEEEGTHELRDRRNLEVAALTQEWSLDLPASHLLRWGFEGRRYQASFDYTKALEPEVLVLGPYLAPRDPEFSFRDEQEGEHLGLFASDRFTLRERLTTELGLRYDRHTASGDTLLSPRLSTALRLGERAVLRASWGRFWQSHRPHELGVEDQETVLHRAERSEHWVLGLEAVAPANALGIEALRLELYRREINSPRVRYENLLEPINFFPDIEPDRVAIAPRTSRADGAELLVKGRAGAKVDWRFAYAYSRAEDRLGSLDVPRALDQPHALSLDLNFRLPRRWRLNLAWRFHSGWPTTPVTAVRVPDPEDPEEEPELAAQLGALRSERLPNYHRLDLRASRAWQRAWGRLTFFVDVQNVYDRANPAGFDLVFDEEAGTVTLERESWPGTFPSLGVSWEF